MFMLFHPRCRERWPNTTKMATICGFNLGTVSSTVSSMTVWIFCTRFSGSPVPGGTPDSGNISSSPRVCNRQACWLTRLCLHVWNPEHSHVCWYFFGGDVLWSKCICCKNDQESSWFLGPSVLTSPFVQKLSKHKHLKKNITGGGWKLTNSIFLCRKLTDISHEKETEWRVRWCQQHGNNNIFSTTFWRVISGLGPSASVFFMFFCFCLERGGGRLKCEECMSQQS